jgi:hypothetical protein
LAEELEAGAEEVVLEVESEDDDSEDELDVLELVTLLELLDGATLLDELVEDAETLAGDELLEELDDVD